MTEIASLALANLLSPMVLCFALGALAALGKADLEIPEAISKGLAIYLMLAIGMKGGAAMADAASWRAAAAVFVGLAFSFVAPFVAYALLRAMRAMGPVDAAAVAAHYGSVSVVTFVAAGEFLNARGLAWEGYLVAVLAAMETPAIVAGLLIARLAGSDTDRRPRSPKAASRLLREVLLNGSIVLLVGGFAVGWLGGAAGLQKVKPFMVDIFNGVLCLFLLDMGLHAVRQLRLSGGMGLRAVGFAVAMPLLSAAAGLLAARSLGLSVGGGALFATLAASASYIAVPAAMRLALPQANPSIYVGLSLGVTFPFNVAVGIPLYAALAQRFWG